MLTRRSVHLGSVLMLAATASKAFAAMKTDRPPAVQKRTVTIQFGTNRQRVHDERLFSSNFEPGQDASYYVTGTIAVNVIDDQFQVNTGSLKVDNTSNVQVRSTAELVEHSNVSEDRFAHFTRARTTVGQTLDILERNDGLLFIPGYAYTFRDSISSAAMLAVYYGTEDVICFSWPSQGTQGLLSYLKDRESSRASAPALAKAFVSFVSPRAASEARGVNLNLLTHSMGAYALAEAIRTIKSADVGASLEAFLSKQYFSHVLLMAADIDADALSDDTALGKVIDMAGSVDVYTNKRDLALAIRQIPNPLQGALGAFGPSNLKDLSGKVLWINASEAARLEDHSLSHHSYFVTSKMVENDARQVLLGSSSNSVRPRVQDRDPRFVGRRYTIGVKNDPA